eukprot:tig00000523_g1861.t1
MADRVVLRVQELAAGPSSRQTSYRGIAAEAQRRVPHEDGLMPAPSGSSAALSPRREGPLYSRTTLTHDSLPTDPFRGFDRVPSEPFRGFEYSSGPAIPRSISSDFPKAPSGGYAQAPGSAFPKAPSGGYAQGSHGGYSRPPGVPAVPPPAHWETIESEPRLQLRPGGGPPPPPLPKTFVPGAGRGPVPPRSTSAPPRSRLQEMQELQGPHRQAAGRPGRSQSITRDQGYDSGAMEPEDLRVWGLADSYELYPEMDDDNEPAIGLPYRHKSGTNRLKIPNPDKNPRVHTKGCCSAWDVVWDNYLTMLTKVGACAEKPIQRRIRRMLP